MGQWTPETLLGAATFAVALLGMVGVILKYVASVAAAAAGLRRDVQEAISFSREKAALNDTDHAEFRRKFDVHGNRLTTLESRSGLHDRYPAA